MPRRVILHVGMPKTGTSSLQRAFALRSDLLRSAGIAYVIPFGQGFAHHALVRAIAERNTLFATKYFEEARVPFESAEQVLFSSESMCRLRGDDLAAWKACLDEQFGNPEYAVWMVARRPSSHIPSQWHARIRSGGRQNLPLFAFDSIMRMLRANRLPVQPLFERYESAFGRACIHVVSMEKLLAGGEFVEAAFKTMFGLEGDRLRGLPRQNAALEPGGAELLRVFSMRRGADDPDQASAFLKPIIRMLRKGNNAFSELVRIFDPFIGEITIDDRSKPFLAMERDALARLGDRLDGWGDGTIFGPDDPSPARYVREDHCFDEGTRQRLGEAYAMAVNLAEQPKRAPRRPRSSRHVAA